MAGDWIKCESSTPDKPEIWDIAQMLGLDPDAVMGKLLRIWIWFDQHTENGNAPIVTKMLLDRSVGVTGFCDCVVKCGWMVEANGNLILPNFDRHNGKTAKNRALTAKRVAQHKAKANTKSNDKLTPNALPKEEERREENKETKKKKSQPKFTPPSLDDVFQYAKSRSRSDIAKKFFDYFDEGGWVDSNNKPVRNWKQKFITWESHTPKTEQHEIRTREFPL